MVRIILVLLFFAFFTTGKAQNVTSSSNHLLWRISGNGLSRPSYLFGTIHLTDKRVFHFGDSLYKALEQSEGFAAELDMNNVFTQYINYIVNEEKEEFFLEKIVDKAVLKKYKSRLEKKFGKPLAKITTGDLDAEKDKQTADLLQSGEMKTFMDAYLFDIADRQGKWTGGIEDPEDQFNLKDEESPEDQIIAMFDYPEEQAKGIEWMINTYLTEQLDLIDKTNEVWKGAKDLILLKRNVKMSFRIDSLAHVRSCLFAVGAAHLPGDSGIVILLRKKGFEVTPVISSQKIAPEKYTFKGVERDWVNVYVQDSLYSIQMPVKPEPFQGLATAAIDMQFHFDMGSYTAYFTLGIQSPAGSSEMKDSLLDRISNNYSKKAIGFIEKKIRIGNLEGREFQLKNGNGEIRIQAFVPGDYVVLNAMFGLKKQTVHSKDAERFFGSFKPGNLEIKSTATKTDGKWQTFEFSDEAFSIDFPGKFRKRTEPDSEEKAWIRKVYEVIDISSQSYYGVTIDETKEGYYSDKDSVYFEDTKTNLVEAMKGEIISSGHTTFQRFPAYELLLKSKQEGEEILSRIFFTNRGNRRYFIFVAYDPKVASIDANTRFFSSFTFLPLKKPGWKKTTAPDNAFTTWAPGDFRIILDTVSGITRTRRYSLFDKAAAATILVDKESFPENYWAVSDSSYFESRIKGQLNWNDSVIRRRDLMNGNSRATDLDIRLGESQNIKKMRMLFSGDTLYTVYAHIMPEIMQQGEYDKLFDEFRLHYERKPVNIFTPKPLKLIAQLRSKDSAVFYSGKELLSMVPFTKTDIPLLLQAMTEQVYRDFDTSYYQYSNVNAMLGAKVLELDSLYSSVDFIRKNYTTLTGQKELLKPLMLSILSQQMNKGSYDLLKDLLSKHPPVIGAQYYFNHGLYDSLLLTKTLFPDILSSAGMDGVGNDISRVAVMLLDSNLIDPSFVRSFRDTLVNAATRNLSISKAELEENSYLYSSLVTLLSEINDQQVNNLLRKYAALESLPLKMEAIIGLARNKQLVAKTELLAIAKSDEYRYSFYDRLSKYGLLKSFPVEYMTQRMLGQSKVFEYAYDEEAPEKIVFVAERIVSFMGQKKKFLLYKVMYSVDDPDTHYLGVAGPYSTDVKDLKSSHDATGLYWDEEYDAKKLDEHLKIHLKETQEYLKE